MDPTNKKKQRKPDPNLSEHRAEVVYNDGGATRSVMVDYGTAEHRVANGVLRIGWYETNPPQPGEVQFVPDEQGPKASIADLFAKRAADVAAESELRLKYEEAKRTRQADDSLIGERLVTATKREKRQITYKYEGVEYIGQRAREGASVPYTLRRADRSEYTGD